MNQIDQKIVHGLAQGLEEELHEDLLNHAWIEQAVRLRVGKDAPSLLYVQAILEEMLKSGEVEIGETTKGRGEGGKEYVAFIAWKRTVQERIARAMREVERWSAPEFPPDWKDFAYWLCLRRNIDGYEGDSPIGAE